MGVLEFLLKIVTDAAPQRPGFQTSPWYILLNLAVPLILGILLSWITQFIEKGLVHFFGERR
ncbi:MAG: hypothetical protein C0407_05355 [Desulfobacca sp.]|nr:hypothetical protein [Desulfobacca sp.]